MSFFGARIEETQPEHPIEFVLFTLDFRLTNDTGREEELFLRVRFIVSSKTFLFLLFMVGCIIKKHPHIFFGGKKLCTNIFVQPSPPLLCCVSNCSPGN